MDASVDNQLTEIGSEPEIMSVRESRICELFSQAKANPLADRIASATVFSDHHFKFAICIASSP
jgi:hypothetical protein